MHRFKLQYSNNNVRIVKNYVKHIKRYKTVKAFQVESTTVHQTTPSHRDVPSISQPLTSLYTPAVISIIRGQQGHFLPSSDTIYVLSHPVTFILPASAAGIASESNEQYDTAFRSNYHSGSSISDYAWSCRKSERSQGSTGKSQFR